MDNLTDLLSFEEIEDSESDRGVNNQWIVHKLIAKLGPQEVGYLKLSYIPKERFDKKYPTIINFISDRGSHCFPEGKEDFHPKDLTIEEQRKILNRLKFTLSIPKFSELPRLESWHSLYDEETYTDNQIVQLMSELLSKKNKNSDMKMYQKNFEEFKEFHMDKPLVDYIRVYESFQRKKIGTALYMKGSEWMKRKGLYLHRSGIHCNENPTKAWEKFEKMGLTKTENGRMYLI